jgi:4-hydroxy 2-oxovalerate aldolase
MILDCTLRDGAHVNGGQFGEANIVSLVSSLVFSNVDLIELGFLEDREFNKDTTFFPTVADAEGLLEGVSVDQYSGSFCLMARTDRFSIDKLKPVSGRVDTIRYAFYPEHLNDLKIYVKRSTELGYKVYLNLIDVAVYAEEELRRILLELNSLDVKGVSIVDTSGTLGLVEFEGYVKLFDEVLNKEFYLGLHLHENLSLSFGMIQYFETLLVGRKAIYDGSLLGMGRIPGNLPLELVMTYFNQRKDCDYNVCEVLDVIENVIKPIKQKRDWGYSPVYMYSAMLGIHRTYPEYLSENKGFSFKDCFKYMDLVKEKNIGSDFDEQALEGLIAAYV